MERSEQFQVAVVDDDPIFLDYISSMLEHDAGMKVLKATNGDELFATLDRQRVECIVLDYNLEGETGLALGQAVKERFKDAPPIVMLTGQGSERTATKAFRIGFSDYVSKRNLDHNELCKAITGAARRRAADELLRQQTERLRQNERFDGLTGLHSAPYVRARLDELCSQKSGSGFAVIAVSLRSLDRLRREFGHAIADRLLHRFAKTLGEATKLSTLCGHLDSESFVCVFEGNTNPSAILNACAGLAGKLAFDAEFDRTRVRAAADIGAALFPQDGTNVNELIDAVLEAKKSADGKKPYGCTHSLAEAKTAVAPAAPTQPEPDAVQRLQERRGAPRHRVLKKGKIVVEGLNAVIDCTVRNMSDTGAQIRVENVFAVPERFKLVITGTDIARRVEKRWQAGRDVGVQYEDGSS